MKLLFKERGFRKLRQQLPWVECKISTKVKWFMILTIKGKSPFHENVIQAKKKKKKKGKTAN